MVVGGEIQSEKSNGRSKWAIQSIDPLYVQLSLFSKIMFSCRDWQVETSA